MRRFVYGVNLDSEDYNPITHIAILTEEEAKSLEDFEDFLERFGDRLVALKPEEED
ncbi:hypothetical protein [Thermus sp.]|jgi:hypothetical protein|uniref:hypothetical protein n=1 Tax=Thermus sp. TaxID=275 RepID=UPI0025ED3423|nr:hypothetical protein [Thermus sp.]MCS6869599.1 hypothetical protein [Thermus sp.]MCX7850176.1 hypothetical protein [Thermus sp.]MDW8017188.1 hypothetical protein [Thermus sp.]MDW8357644.1 hypothetical protein [Thermus sp.]